MKLNVKLFLLIIICGVLFSVVAGNKKKHHKPRHNTHNKNRNQNQITPTEDHNLSLVVIRETIAAVGLILCFAGSRILKVTVFIGGFILLFVFTYITLPSIVDNETCCGPKGNWIARVGVCVGVAILGGLLSLFVYYVGIFAIGGIFGMICALVALSTPLAEKEFFDSAMAVGLFYGAFIIVGGLLSLLLSTISVAAASSLGGSYAVFWGVDYFAKTNFSGGIEVLIVQIQDHIRTEFGMTTAHRHHPDFFRVYSLRDVVIFTFFLILAVMGFVFQLYLSRTDVKLKSLKECSTNCHCKCKEKSSEYLLEYLRSIHSSRDSMAQFQGSKEPFLKPMMKK